MENTNLDVSPSAIAIPILCSITFVLCLPPFVWHVKNRNLAASSLVLWILLDNLFAFINALIWPTDDIASWWNGTVLCDIEVKLMMAGTAGLTGSMACIMRNLGKVMDTSRTVLEPSMARKRRETALNILLCFGCPVYLMVIHYVVQPNRYYLFAIAGCTVSYDNSWPSTVLVFMWPPILCVLAAYYCAVVIIRLHKYRRDFADILTSSGSNLTKSRFMRLFLIAFIFIVICLPVQFYVFYRNFAVYHVPYSWKAIHGAEWWQIAMVPTGGVVRFDRWIWIGSGFLVFFFFGLGKDATRMYRGWLLKLGFGKIFPSLSGHCGRPTTSGSSRNRFSSLSNMVKLLCCRTRSRGQSEMPFYHDRQGSVITEVVTPSPSDPKKTFFRKSGASEPYRSSPQRTKAENPLAPYPVEPKPWESFELRREHHPDTNTQTPSRSIFAPEASGRNQSLGELPKAWTTGHNTNEDDTSGSSFQPGMAPVKNELPQLTEHYGEQ